MKSTGKSIVVTGASSGIGLATAEELVRHGYRVYGSVRRAEDGARLQSALGPAFAPLVFDITDSEAIQRAAAQVAQSLAGASLAGLVNNAGIVRAGPLLHMPLQELRKQLEVNVVGMLGVTQAFLPLLGAAPECRQPPGRVVNISSVSGSIAYPFLGPYAASKHALEALSTSLRRELLPYGVDVIVVAPGSVRTPIWDKTSALDLARYVDSDYYPVLAALVARTTAIGDRSMSPQVVARTIRRALESPRPKTRYVVPHSRLVGWWLPRWLPDRWFDRLIAHALGLHRLNRRVAATSASEPSPSVQTPAPRSGADR